MTCAGCEKRKQALLRAVAHMKAKLKAANAR